MQINIRVNKNIITTAVLPLILGLLTACQAVPQAPVSAAATVTPGYLLLGEVHDHAAGHQARLAVIRQQLATNQPTALVLEQFDTDQQTALDEAQRLCSTADCLLQTLKKPGLQWQWPLYSPLIQLALDQKVPLIAGNLSRSEARRVMKEGYRAVFAEADIKRWQLSEDDLANSPHHAVFQVQQQEVLKAHCGQLPLSMAAGMTKAQIARDIVMTEKLFQQNRRSILIAGNGHVRKDIGVAYWLRFAGAESVHSHLFAESAVSAASADTQTLLPPQNRPDPCAGMTINTKPGERT
jgi:uncharacterized iron-regulated protein